MAPKDRDAIDGGPMAQKLWEKVDQILYRFENGEKKRSGGLQVLARSLPDDKLKLVRRFMKNDEIVGVTGDGTNDAPALRNANVGLAMGSGTQVARDAAHITILDDNFSSIVNAVKWGRNVFDNVRKFLQFQLTVNIVALTLTFVMACAVDGDVTKELPLNAVMLLWVNLIMDSMGALALATEKPTDALLDRPPHGKERLLSISMIRMNIAQAIFQLIILHPGLGRAVRQRSLRLRRRLQYVWQQLLRPGFKRPEHDVGVRRLHPAQEYPGFQRVRLLPVLE